MNHSNTTVESVMKLVKNGFTRKEIKDKLGYTNDNNYYQRIRYIFKDSPDEYEEYKTLLAQTAKDKSKITKYNNTPKTIYIKQLKEMLEKGFTKYDIIKEFNYRSFGGFYLTLKRTCQDDMVYQNIVEKLDENTRTVILQLSETLTKKEICEYLKIRQSSLYSTARSIFGTSESYTTFFQNLSNPVQKDPQQEVSPTIKDVAAKDFPKEPVVLLHAKNETTKKLDIYHHTYLINLSIESLRNELNSDNLKLIPRTIIDTMLKDKHQFKKHLVIISECLQRQSDHILNDFVTYYDTTAFDATQHDYYLKLALLYQRKDYDVTLYCNIPKIIADCLLYQIKVKHNAKYEFKVPDANPIDDFVHGYDTSYLQHRPENLQTAQPKLICECVLQEILKNNFDDLLYYIVDSNTPEHNFIFVGSNAAYLSNEFKRYHSNDSIVLDTFQFFELQHKHKVLVKTLDLNCQLEAIQLGFKTHFLPTEISAVEDKNTESELPFISKFEKIPSIISNMSHFILCEDVSAVFYDVKLKHAISPKALYNKLYYKVEINNYIVLKHCTNAIYKVVAFNDNIVNLTLFKNNYNSQK